MRSRYFITGGTGFIGSNIVRTLVEKNQDVHIIVRNKKLNWRIADVASRLNVYESDIENPSLGNLLKKIQPDYIFHLASYGVLPKEEDQGEMVDINIKGTINLVNAAKKVPFKLFINTGSCVEYGIKENPMKESDILTPINDYGITKAAATLYCQKEGIRNNLPIITFRQFTPFGYFEAKSRLIPDVILNAIQNKTIRVSSSKSVRDFIFIEDVVNAYLLATTQAFSSGDIFNIGSGEQHSVGDIVRIVVEKTGTKSRTEWGAVKKQARFIEPTTWRADMTKTKKICNGTKNIPLKKE